MGKTANISMDFFVKRKNSAYCKKLFFDKGLTPAPATNVFCLPDPSVTDHRVL
jgi:hypothetical protein